MRLSIPFLATDLSATCYTAWAPIPPQAKKFAIGVGTTATGSPVGQISIQVATHKNPAVDGVAPLNAQGGAITVAATNGAGKQLIDNIATGADAIRMKYTVTSGGVGAVFTDDSGVAGSAPSLVFKE